MESAQPVADAGMKATAEGRVFDMVYIGTGMIPVLDAIYQSLSGKSVLMVDQQAGFGGSWRSLDIFGLHDVENAIHYMLPDPYAPAFMTDVLRWDVVGSPRKYRVFDLPVLGRRRIGYDLSVGRILARLAELSAAGEQRGLWKKSIATIRDELSGGRQPSYYVRGGVPEMLRKVQAMLEASAVEVRYSTPVDRIHIDKSAATVEIFSGSELIRSQTIVFSHGSKIKNLSSPSGPFLIEDQYHPRPAAHLLVKDDGPSEIHECIFAADPLIKYAHDVSRFTRESAELEGRRKVIVLALHHHISNRAGVFRAMVERLQWAGMIGPNAVLEDHIWSDIVLPSIGDSDLEKIKSEFGPQVEYLRTENFASGVGSHAKRWASKLKSNYKAAGARAEDTKSTNLCCEA